MADGNAIKQALIVGDHATVRALLALLQEADLHTSYKARGGKLDWQGFKRVLIDCSRGWGVRHQRGARVDQCDAIENGYSTRAEP